MWRNSFFSQCKLPCNEIMSLAYAWLTGATHTMLCHIGGHSKNTVTAFMRYFRELIATDVSEDLCMVGGPNLTVEIDESKLARRKYNRGHRVNGCWVVGSVERGPEKRFFVCSVADRTAETLKMIIRSHVRPGSVIVTDCWRGYDWLDDDPDYAHMKVNHSIGFRDEETGAHTNTIEGNWAGLKLKIPKRNRTEGEEVDLHLLGFIWRRQNRDSLWISFITALVDTHYD